ncbi:MAG: hypothetical protein NTX47_06245 [Candidatus Omnitrophica bacterium]|nr:hypothetical protein [Candidatus Omnitrophota bacterium]
MGKTRKIISLILLISFIYYNTAYSADKKEELNQYVMKVNPILLNVQITARNISQRFFTLEAGMKQVDDYLKSLKAIKPPNFMVKQHKMILLAFKKMRMGFYLLSHGKDKAMAISLVKRSGELLRIAGREMVDFADKEGLLKKKEQGGIKK